MEEDAVIVPPIPIQATHSRHIIDNDIPPATPLPEERRDRSFELLKYRSEGFGHDRISTVIHAECLQSGSSL